MIRQALQDTPEEYFYNPINQIIFRGFAKMESQGIKIGVQEATHFFREIGELDKIGGAYELSCIFTQYPAPHQYPYFNEILREKAIQRQGIAICERNMQRIYAAQPSEALDWTAEMLAEVMKLNADTVDKGRRRGLMLREIGMLRLEQLSQPRQRGLSTGFGWLDQKTGGLIAGKKWVIAGGHSDGKSSLALQIGLAASMANAPGSIYSLEMPHEEVWDRAASQEARIRSSVWKDGILTQGEKRSLTDFVKSQYPVKVHDDLDRWEEIMASLAIEKAERNIQWAIIDYLQLAQGDKKAGREQEVAGMSGASKRAAKRLGITLIELSQLNDQGELRESRSIGADADVVLKIDKVADNDQLRIMHLFKNRGGPRFTKCMYEFNGEYFLFTEKGELSKDQEEQNASPKKKQWRR